MSNHIGAGPGEIANTVLLPGDPLRAKFIAENLLQDAVCYNEVRGMYGFTGTYNGKRVSVQGTGMGVPSISIYIHELMAEYGVDTLVRIGTCGAIQEDLAIRDVILATAASTDSQINKLRFRGMDYAPAADFSLLKKAHDVALKKEVPVRAGGILTCDTFYSDDPEDWKLWARFGILAIEMESAALYTLAAKWKARALAVLTVSNSIVTGEESSHDDRERTFTQMAEIALELA